MKVNKDTIKIDLELFGSEFANLDSGEQAKFFKGLARELKAWKTHSNKQMQFAYVGQELDDEEKEELANALQMIFPESYL